MYKDWYRTVKPGDHIITYNNDETDHIESKVLDVRKYKNIKEMLDSEPLNKMLPDINTVTEGLKVYSRFYTEEQERKFGAVAIGVEIVGQKNEG